MDYATLTRQQILQYPVAKRAGLRRKRAEWLKKAREKERAGLDKRFGAVLKLHYTRIRRGLCPLCKAKMEIIQISERTRQAVCAHHGLISVLPVLHSRKAQDKRYKSVKPNDP